MSGGVLNQMPFLRFFAPNSTGYNRLCHVLNEFEKFFNETIFEHKKKLNNEPNDLIDLFLIEMNQRCSEGKNSSFDGNLILN